LIHPLELFIGLRYTRARRRNHFISFISVMATLGIVLGVAAMITVLSVMNGFGNELRNRILGVVSHVTIEAKRGNLQDWKTLLERIQGIEGIRGIAPYIEGQAMLSSDRGSRGVVVRGILPQEERKVSEIHNRMQSGTVDALAPGEFGILIGRELAWRIGAVNGSRISLVANETVVTPAGLMPRFKQFTVVGIFEIGHGDYDDGFALINMEDAAHLYRKGTSVSGLRLELSNLFSALPLANRLQNMLGTEYKVKDWSQTHQSFFRALRIEKAAMFITMMLIVAVAAFNIIAMLTMLISDKRSDIAILRTLGMSPNRTMTVFLYHGSILGVLGTLLGVGLGILLSLNIAAVISFFEQLSGRQLMTENVYYVTTIVADLQLSDVTTIALCSLFLTIASAAYPARRAAQIQPAEALRYE